MPSQPVALKICAGRSIDVSPMNHPEIMTINELAEYLRLP
jgi:hypothetical protein